MHAPPAHMNPEAWRRHYAEETTRLESEGFDARRDAFNAEFPTPYTGPVTCSDHARFAAICDYFERDGAPWATR